MGFRDGSPGRLQFQDEIGWILLDLPLECTNGLYYCPHEIFEAGKGHTIPYESDEAPIPDMPAASRIRDRRGRRPQPQRCPVHPAQHLESELWAAQIGHCGEWQLDVLPGHAEGLPPKLEYHLFRFLDYKEQATVRR